MIAVESDAPDYVRRVHNALGIEWSRANKEEIFLFVGACTCKQAQETMVFQTSDKPIAPCIFCGAPVEHIPLWQHVGGNTWKRVEKNSDGKYIVNTLSIPAEINQSVALGVTES